MHNSNFTVLALNALPASSQSLASADDFQVLCGNLWEALYIQRPPDEEIQETPTSDHGIQLVILDITENGVTLGIHSPRGIRLERGPAPSAQWQQHFNESYLGDHTIPVPEEKAAIETSATSTTASITDTPETPSILCLRDELYDLQAAYQFFGTTVKAALRVEEYIDMPRKTQHGYAVVLDWILDQGDRLLQRMDQCLETSRVRRQNNDR